MSLCSYQAILMRESQLPSSPGTNYDLYLAMSQSSVLRLWMVLFRGDFTKDKIGQSAEKVRGQPT